MTITMSNKKKILIIEDETILGELLMQRLGAEGCETVWAVDGKAGMEKMREVLPDLVLLDIVMPKKDGYEVLTEMRADAALKDIPVIVISNSGQPVEIKRIVELGVKDYIVKAQFSPDEVLDKVCKYLNMEKRSAEEKSAKKESSGVKILIVEDDPFLSSIAFVRLEQEGYEVSVATDGEKALALLEKEIPDLILLDIVLPGVNGFDVLKAVKADKRWKDISVIIFSNLGQEHEIEDSKKFGADDFLVKAKFTPREVLEKIRRLLEKKGRI